MSCPGPYMYIVTVHLDIHAWQSRLYIHDQYSCFTELLFDIGELLGDVSHMKLYRGRRHYAVI